MNYCSQVIDVVSPHPIDWIATHSLTGGGPAPRLQRQDGTAHETFFVVSEAPYALELQHIADF